MKEKFEAMGVEVEFDTALVNDTRLLYLLGAVQSAKDTSAMGYYTQLCDLMFDDPMDVLTRLAEKNGGVADAATFGEFLVAILNKASAKNSPRSQSSTESTDRSCERTSSSTTA